MSRYALPADLQALALSAAALDGIDVGEQQTALDAASAELDSYIAGQFTLPLVPPYPQDLVQHTCSIAAYRLLKVRGFNPEPGSNDLVVADYKAAISWAKDVGEAKVNPAIVDSSPPAESTPIIRSSPSRGFKRWC